MKQKDPFQHSRLTGKCLLTICFLAAFSSISRGQSSLAQSELRERRDSIIAAEEMIQEGDKFYRSGNFSKATDSYRGAFAQIPVGDKTNAFREAAKERFAQSAVQAARVMNREGNREGAIALIDEVLAEQVAPGYGPALKVRAQFDDPIRTNPSATPEHAQKVDEVRRLLYSAEGAYNLGDFDKSYQTYESILRIDPTNKAARRGMERVTVKMSDYAGAAYDQRRAAMLSELAGQWELKVNEETRNPSLFASGGLVQETLGESINDKLDSIIIPVLDFEDLTLEEAIEFLEARSQALDSSLEAGSKGVDFVINMGSGASPEANEILNRQFNLRLQNVSLRVALDYITEQTSTKFKVDAFAVVISPLAGITNDLVVKRYQVPPTFLSQAPGQVSGDLNDPFGGGEKEMSKLAPRLTARQFLQGQGVPFPDGATASYLSSLNQLTVKTTSAGHDLVSAIVEAINSEEPVAVIIETKFIQLSQTNLEELAFDTTLGELATSGDLVFGAGTTGNGRAPAFGDGSPITSGLRSGDSATSGEPLFSRIANDASDISPLAGGITSQQAAPGVLSVMGQINDTGYSVLLRGLDQKKATDTMAQPSVVVRSGEQAIIETTREIIYPTEYEPPQLPDRVGFVEIGGVLIETDSSTFPVTPAHPTAFETRTIGTLLEVTPTISADRNYVDVQLSPRIDEFLGFINYGTPILGSSFGDAGVGNEDGSFNVATRNEILMPIFSSTRASTSATIQSGYTLLIGGLLSEKAELVEDKVPILGSLPLVGKFFTSDAHRREKQAVLIFVTVRVVDPGGKPISN